jgi:hypothetical protein
MDMSGIPQRLAALSPEKRACFALACAERLVVRTSSTRQKELRTALDQGWSVLNGHGGDVAALRSSFDSRSDLDDDEVAAVAYALEAVRGDADAAYWAASRSLDAAFELVRHAGSATEFRPLGVDAADPVVKEEVAWQERAITGAEEAASLPELMQRIRLG